MQPLRSQWLAGRGTSGIGYRCQILATLLALLPAVHVSHSLTRDGKKFDNIQGLQRLFDGGDRRELSHFVLLVNTLPVSIIQKVRRW